MRTMETVNAMSLMENLYWSMQFGNAALLFVQLLWMWDWQRPISVVRHQMAWVAGACAVLSLGDFSAPG
jgi:hypothetical protein